MELGACKQEKSEKDLSSITLISLDVLGCFILNHTESSRIISYQTVLTLDNQRIIYPLQRKSIWGLLVPIQTSRSIY